MRSPDSRVAELDVLPPTRARVDLGRLAANYEALLALVRLPVMPVVKAEAYGHGAAMVARRLVAQGAPRLAVAYVQEAIALRRAGITVPIVVLAGFTRAQAPAAVEHALTPVISTPDTLDAALAVAGGAPPVRPWPVHLKVDTGMARLGFAPDAFLDAALRLAESGRVEVEGVMTHLASADEDAEVTRRQLDVFDDAVARVQSRGIRPTWIHACNSAGLAFVRPTHTLVRPGLLVYGVRPRPLSPAVDVRPVMTVASRVALVKDVPAGAPVSYGGRWVAQRPSRLATIPMGYADGVPRTDGMREAGSFVIGGHRAPVAGTVCMDLTMADVTDLPGVQSGDEAVLLGDEPDAWEVAQRAGTTAWESLTRIGPRVPRVYVEEGRVHGVWSPLAP